jgi:hypothetical protein
MIDNRETDDRSSEGDVNGSVTLFNDRVYIGTEKQSQPRSERLG